jgi:hypothetical protein
MKIITHAAVGFSRETPIYFSSWVKDENGDLLADLHNILNGSENNLSQQLNVYEANNVILIGKGKCRLGSFSSR